jgi:alkyl hydroperoxide reductase subunit AhpC
MQQIESANTQVFALSVDTPERSAGFQKEMQLPFDLLCDPDKNVVPQFNLLNPHEHDGIAYPAIFVINAEGRICYRSLDRTASRVQLVDVLAVLEKLKNDPFHAEEKSGRKAFIIPSPGEMGQIAKNMLFRGSTADWKHYVKFTFVHTPRNIFKTITRPFRSGK